MTYPAVKLLIVYVLATLLACGVGAWLAARYRRALLPLMSAPTLAPPPTLGPTQAMVQASLAPRAPVAVSLADHRRAMRWLVLALLGLSLVIALTRGVIWTWFVKDSAVPFSGMRFMVLAIVYSWPVLPALGLIWRWRWRHLALAMLAWYALSVGMVMLVSNGQQSIGAVVVWLAWEAGWPVLALMLLTLPRTRAAAPWLWLPMSMIVLMALAGLDVLGALVQSESPLVVWLSQWLPPVPAMLLFTAVGAAIAAWPAWQFGRVLAQAYADKWVSELIVVYSAAWVLNLVFEALTDGPLMLLPLLWLPLAVVLGRQVFLRNPLTDRRSTAPTLMVLRVFKQDRNVAALFEEVVERWRVSGRTVLIAGTDLVDHTLDAADLLGFLEGRLAERFVVGENDVQRRLMAFDWERDPDGRFRINECYCHDTSWKYALAALVQRSRYVLMDLRGFTAANAGCRYELAVLARAPHALRVVAVVDDTSDLPTAMSDAEGAPPGRFTWLTLPTGVRARAVARQRVLAALLTPAAAHGMVEPPNTSTNTSAAAKAAA
jgi:hypothetical protein